MSHLIHYYNITNVIILTTTITITITVMLTITITNTITNTITITITITTRNATASPSNDPSHVTALRKHPRSATSCTPRTCRTDAWRWCSARS